MKRLRKCPDGGMAGRWLACAILKRTEKFSREELELALLSNPGEIVRISSEAWGMEVANLREIISGIDASRLAIREGDAWMRVADPMILGNIEKMRKSDFPEFYEWIMAIAEDVAEKIHE